MKKKLLFALLLAVVLTCVFAVSVSAEVTTYDDAPVRTKYQCIDGEIIEFYDGFKCPVSYVFKDTSTVGTGDYNTKFADYMDFSYINGKLGRTEEAGNLYTYADVKGFDIPTGITHVAKYAGKEGTTLKWITFPDTISSLSNAIFQSATGLEECTLKFSENNTMRVFPSYMFFGCKNLKAFSMPDCFTSLYDVAHFSGCTSLSAVHLSNSLEVWSSGGGGSRTATFDDCVNMYFVNEAFTYENIPQKPEVYYFPANLRSILDNSVCRECKNLNDVLVFGTQLTEMPNEYFFQNGPANKIVFLGDMTTVETKYWGKTTQIIFANPADKSTDDVTYSGGRTTVFCHAEGNTTHLAERTAETEATCTLPKMVSEYCFCGAVMGEPVSEGNPLGHNHTEYAGYVYENYMAQGYIGYKCERCDDVNKDQKVDALFTSLGISAKTFGADIGLVQGYAVNRAAIEIYKSNTEGFDFGVLAYANKEGTACQPKPGDEKVVDIVFNNMANDYIEVKLTGIPEDYVDTTLVLCIYVEDKGGFYYLNDGTTAETVIGNSYSGLAK